MANTSPDAIIIVSPSNDLYVKGAQQYDMLFATTCNIQSICFGYSNMYMKIASNGNVGIGTSNPSAILDVAGTTRINTSTTGGILLGNLTSSNASANGIVQIAGVDSSKAGLSIITTNSVSQGVVSFHNPNGQIGNITLNASTTAYNTSSDYRLKTNIEPLTNIWETFIQLNPVTFNFKSDLNTQVQGFIAHEVQDIVPLAVSGTKDAIDEYDNPIYQGIDATKLIPLLVAAVKDLKTELLQKNKLLEDRIELLENHIKK